MTTLTCQRCDPFSQLPINGARPEESWGALEPAQFDPDSPFSQFTGAQLDEIYRSVRSRSRWWNFWTAVKLLIVVGFLVTTYVLLPLGVMHRWPFN